MKYLNVHPVHDDHRRIFVAMISF